MSAMHGGTWHFRVRFKTTSALKSREKPERTEHLNARLNTFIQRHRQVLAHRVRHLLPRLGFCIYSLRPDQHLLFYFGGFQMWLITRCDCTALLHILSQHSYLCLGCKRSGSAPSFPNKVQVSVFQLQGQSHSPRVYIKLQRNFCDSSC